jgi:hypothetical protein
VQNERFERTNREVEHSHDQDHSVRAGYEIAFEELRNLVRERLDSKVITLYRQVQQRLPPHIGNFMNWANCRRTLQRIRNRAFPPCTSLVQLQNYLEDVNSAVFQQYGTLHGNPFYVGSVEGMMMFANMTLIDNLPGLVELFIDGTFNVTPFDSRQLLVVLAELQGRPRPIFYAIMNTQLIVDYQPVFEFMRDAVFGPDRQVMSIMKDFEQAIRTAAANVWPNAQSKGCNFHHDQALEKNAKQTAGLVGKLGSGTKHRFILLMFMRISLLPLNRIDAGFEACLDQIQDFDINNADFTAADFDEFIEYFQNTWFVRFPRELWCVSDEIRRTNNHVEGHNRKIKETIEENPNPWEFLIGLRDLMIDATMQYERDRRVNAEPPRDLSRLSAPLEEALHKLANGQFTELDFLRFMAAS